jgi:ribA/ribD-fused uncharacterized protein
MAVPPRDSQRFVTDKVALIRAPADLAALANMTDGYTLAVGSLSMRTSEHLYQASKLRQSDRRSVLAAAEARDAKAAAYQARELWHPDWDNMRISVMRWCLAVKLQQHWDQIAPILIATHDLSIVEWSRKDSFWGALPQPNGTLVGFNHLGMLWEELRVPARLVDRRRVSELAATPSCLSDEWAWPRT